VVTVVGAILTAIQPHPDALGPPEPPWRVFGQGVVVNVLNPKCALYFLAFLPQFVDPSAGTAWSQVLVLGISFVVLGLLTNGLYALAGGAAGEWMRRRGSSAVRRAQRWVAGGVFLVLDVATAGDLNNRRGE
jgi:threonine/homoserine/homoserine lactone efflux protein